MASEQRQPSTQERSEELAEAVGLHSLKPAPGSRKDRKRVGRGHGSGHGKTAGRGHKGYGSRAGAKHRARFEGGQNPIHMRMRKLRGPNKKMSMPFEPFRTHTQHVNLDDLERRFDDGAAIDLDDAPLPPVWPSSATSRSRSSAAASCRRSSTSRAHKFSKSARERIEAAGGTCVRSSRISERPCLHDPELLPRRGDPQEAPVHGSDAGAVPAGVLHPGAGHQPRRRQRDPAATTAAAASSTC